MLESMCVCIYILYIHVLYEYIRLILGLVGKEKCRKYLFTANYSLFMTRQLFSVAMTSVWVSNPNSCPKNTDRRYLRTGP
jgi:NADH:ubiquinone oxidoreductase subunit 6 (subunit J)